MVEHSTYAEELEVTCYNFILISAAKVTSTDDTNNKNSSFFPLHI